MKQNKGFSLIELLVAITILAIIAVPIMHGFVTASRTNAKARKVEQATVVAQNVMEDVKATPIEELLARDGVEREESPMYVYESGEEVEFVSYTIPYNNQIADGVEYKALVMLDAGVGVDDGQTQATDYNQHELPELYDMNSVYDAFFILEDATDTALISKLAQSTGVSETMVRRGVTRNICVDIKDELGTEIVEVNVAYTYGAKTCYMATQNQCIYSNSDAETGLRNIYVFFSPLSNMQEGDAPKESVTIRNTNCNGTAEGVQVYLAKQGDSEGEHYAVNVNVTEVARDLASYQDANGNLLTKTKICTNLSYPKSVEDVAADQIVVRYGTSENTVEESLSIMGKTYTADELVGLVDLSAPVKQDWIYNVQVNVYEKDADESGEALVYLMGTKEK